MSKRLLAVLLTLLSLSAAVAVADSEGADSVILISISDIRSGDSSLSNWGQVSSGQPDGAALDVLKEAGFTIVIDIRAAGEDRGMDEATEVAARKMKYISFPIAAANDISYDNARELDRLLSSTEGPVLVHCASGNRVGALYALREKLAGASDEEALAVGKAAGLTQLEAIVIERFSDE